jgi:Ni/Co efflux regulator RcnB
MRKLSLSILAASIALSPSGAFAQAGPPAPGPRGPMHGPNMGMHGPNMGMHGPNMQMQGNMRMRHMGPMGGQHFQRRLQRGFVVPPFWFGPQFQIGNWQMYGFSDPGADGRWIRYYDDAYLIDRGGRVLDTREGLDWDRYGEEWDMADGIPAYRGGRDDGPDDEDDDRGDGRGDREDHGRHFMHPGGPMPGPGYGYGGGYGHSQVYGGGYGYGMYAYPIVIETVTTSGGGYSEEVVEEYVQVRRAHHRPRARCVCRAPRPAPPPRPRPPAGERG